MCENFHNNETTNLNVFKQYNTLKMKLKQLYRIWVRFPTSKHWLVTGIPDTRQLIKSKNKKKTKTKNKNKNKKK